MEDEDLEFFSGQGAQTASFLRSLDEKGISLSKRVITQQRKAERPKPAKRRKLDEALSASGDEDEEPWSSTLESLPATDEEDGEETDEASDEEDTGDTKAGSSDSEEELTHERRGRARPTEWEPPARQGPARLPVKLADGTIKPTGNLPAPPSSDESESEAERVDPIESWAAAAGADSASSRREDVATAARFGRPAVVDLLKMSSRKAKIQRVKEELATICQDIVADPENNLGLLRRLHTFAQAEVKSPTLAEPVANDPIIRKLAILSELAVFKDIVPGFRIRVLTELEKAQKVSQTVLHQREFEQGLLAGYQQYLKAMEAELKAKSDLAEVCLHCMCTLLTDLTHFNYRVNIMNSVVAYLSKKSWDSASDTCLNSIISVFRNDANGSASLELVRLLNRMIKERHYRVHPNVLPCLLHLRLKSELKGVRASQNGSSKDTDNKKTKPPKVKMSKKERKAANPHMSKKAKEAAKELKKIEQEMDEAAAEVDEEDRAGQQTETLKLLFVLYFSIIKNPRPTRLLSGALEGISRYAHLVNIDFFRDLLVVLRQLILKHEPDAKASKDQGEAAEDSLDEEIEENDLPKDPVLRHRELKRRRLLCITTAFELLSGQGEAITIDLSDFSNHLYAIISELTLSSDIDDLPITRLNSTVKSPTQTKPESRPTPSKVDTKSLADLLFRTLYLVFPPRSPVHNVPPWRTAAFAKRVLACSLHWPSATVLRALEFVEVLLVKEPRIEGLLSTEDKAADGVYRGDLDDPQLCNAFTSSFWELRMLSISHYDEGVRKAAKRLANHSRA
ncbi:hypothetical protein M407DRAFT_232764 [Tulasnella calospora MUT 4182]|uniref:Nucleolar complex-associated protein 3 n=1 Tax=Tulasnella calospora MUT 4182 TaxID=1051891 RepID=A0A0C3QLJ1_9AGAM|nr:hypothetical protein M407DRAFT_232764 [Tulasnella calospora MUT 4182]